MGMHADDAIDQAENEMSLKSNRLYMVRKLMDGIHTTEDGQEIELTNMTSNHLQNCIKYWKLYGNSPYKEELESRGIFYNS